jgi:hypothetical protein
MHCETKLQLGNQLRAIRIRLKRVAQRSVWLNSHLTIRLRRSIEKMLLPHNDPELPPPRDKNIESCRQSSGNAQNVSSK